MSVLDDLRHLEQQLVARLRELRPLVAEYEQLREVAERLGVQVKEPADGDTATPPTGAKRTSASRGPSSTRRVSARRETTPSRSRSMPAGRRRARAGVNREADVLRIVRARPGVTVRQIAEALGVDPTSLYRPVHRLQDRGEITKDGVRLQPTRLSASADHAEATGMTDGAEAANSSEPPDGD
jgi:hypothetical protein